MTSSLSLSPALPVHVAAALLGTRDAARLAAFLGQPLARVAQALHAMPGDAGDDDDAVVADWFAHAPARAGGDVEAAIFALAEDGTPARAARLARRHGHRDAQRRLLRAHGWTLLLSDGPARQALDALLPAAMPGPDPVDDALHALHLAWLVESRRLPHEAERRWRERPVAEAGVQALLQSRAAQMYDDPRAAGRLGAAAVAALPEGAHPAAGLARFAHGVAMLDAGQPRPARQSLAAALRAATRDGQAALQVDALRALAWAHEEVGDGDAAASAVARACALADEAGLVGLHAVDSARRLAAMLALRREAAGAPRDDAALAAVQGGHPFAVRLLAASASLLQGRVADAQREASALAREALETYQPRQWRVALSWLQAALAGRAGDADVLRRIAFDPAAGDAMTTPGDATWHDLQAAVVAAAAARLAGGPLPAEALRRLHDELGARGLGRLQARLALVRSLGDDTRAEEGAEVDALLAWARDPAADPLDAVWLGPCTAGPLARLSREARLGADPALADRVRQLAERARGAGAVAADDAPGGLPPSRPPADLTDREWDVLRLIARELTNEQIATRLGVSVATVKTHINRAYAKLSLRSRAEAAHRARALEARSG